MSDAFREVDEELRKEYFLTLWKIYGPWLIGSVVGGILMVSGWVAWTNYVEGSRERESAAFEAAVNRIELGDRSGAAEAFARIGESSASGYSALSLFREAALYVSDNDLAAAVLVYDVIAEDDDERFAGLANLLAGMAFMNADQYTQARSRLQGIAVPSGDWYYSAAEMLALIDFAEGAIDEAESAFSILAIDPQTPQGILRRVNEMLDLIESERGVVYFDLAPPDETIEDHVEDDRMQEPGDESEPGGVQEGNMQ